MLSPPLANPCLFLRSFQHPLAPRPVAARAAGLVIAALLLLPPAWAQKAAPTGTGTHADRALPIDVEADRMQHDDARQTTTFIGNVLLTRGTLRIRSDRLVISQDGKGGQMAQAQGSPATFRQRRDGTSQIVEGFGRHIDYDSRAEKVTLTGQPRINRFVCDRPSDSITGAVIVYDTRSELFTVDGQRAHQGDKQGDGAPRGRVRLVIQPRDAGGSGEQQPGHEQGARGRSAPAGDDGCEPGAATRLQPSTSIARPRDPDPTPAAVPAAPSAAAPAADSE